MLSVRDRAMLLAKLARSHDQAVTLTPRHSAEESLEEEGEEEKGQQEGRKKRKAGQQEDEEEDNADIDAEEELLEEDGEDAEGAEATMIIKEMASFATEDKRGLSLHLVRAQIAYAAFVAKFLFNPEEFAAPAGGANDARSRQASQINAFDEASSELDDTETFLLTRSALECALKTVESLMCSVVSNLHTSGAGSTAAADVAFQELDESVWSTMPLTTDIMSIILQSSSSVASKEFKESKLGFGSSFANLGVDELAFRCLLGLFRLHALCETRVAVVGEVAESSEDGEGYAELVREAVSTRLGKVTKLMKLPVKFTSLGRAFLVSTSSSTSALLGGQHSSMSAAAPATESTQGGGGDSLARMVLQQLSRFAHNLDEPEQNKQQVDVAKKCNLIIVPILSELMQYLQDAKKAKYLSKVAEVCDKMLKEPSKPLTRSLFKLFLYASTTTTDDRKRQLAELSGSIKLCLTKCEEACEYDSDTSAMVDSYHNGKGAGVADSETRFDSFVVVPSKRQPRSFSKLLQTLSVMLT